MIILDTNVVSEPTKPEPSRSVLLWMDRQNPDAMYLTSTSLGELLAGMELLPLGKKRASLTLKLQELVATYFGPRILPFERLAAVAYASLIGQTRAKGFSMSIADAQIATVALVHGFAVATRDTEPFLAAGVRVIDPWQE